MATTSIHLLLTLLIFNTFSVLLSNGKAVEENEVRVKRSDYEASECDECGEEEPHAPLQCPPDEFKCGTGWKCITKTWLCDGAADCADESDEVEEYCRLGRVPGPCEGEFNCGNDQCVPLSALCDNTNDCTDGADEANCTRGPTCKHDDFLCADGKCVRSHWICDGYPDCADGMDEDDCENYVCPHHQYRCDNHQCIDVKLACDGRQNCRDGSDEENCPDRK